MLRKVSFSREEQDNHIATMTTVFKSYDVETGNKLINNFMILKEIGRGVHGKVKLAQDLTTNELVAIKIVDKKNRKRQMGYSLLRNNNTQDKEQENEIKIRREISILRKCCHPNVIQLRQVIDDPLNRKIYLALEYTQKGEIEWRDQYDKPVLSIIEARNIFRHVVNGLDYLHYQGIIHRDIKPANLLLSNDGTVKISDFGVSYYNELLEKNSNISTPAIDKELAETAGTPAFFAPELCCASNQTKKISKSIDIWALGVTLYCFIFGVCPFIAATEYELFDTIPIQPLHFPWEIDDQLAQLLTGLLQKDPNNRWTLKQVKYHPWTTTDLNNPKEWINSTYDYLQQQEEDLSVMDKLRQSIRKLSFSFAGSERRKSTPNIITSNNSTMIHNSNRPLSYNNGNKPTFILSHTATSNVQPTVSLSTGHILNQSTKAIHPLRPISSSYLSEEEEQEEDYDDEDDYGTHKRPDISRRVSSASSSSGLGLTFGNKKKYTTMTPIE